MIRIEKLPSYLSPSALMHSETMPHTFYLTRLIADQVEREPQEMAAAVGSSFDYYIKMKLIEDRFPFKDKYLPELKNSVEIVGLANKDEAYGAGKRAYNAYVRCGAYNPDEFHNVELHLDGLVEGVPLLGKLDSTVLDLKGDKIKVIPHDWKVQGYTSKSNTSPNKGYYRIWDGVTPKPAHKLYEPEIPFEVIDPKWALQLCTYGWLMGYKVGEPFYARLDALLWGATNIRVIAQYRGLITPGFQKIVMDKYKRLWKELNDGSFLNRLEATEEDLVWIASKQERWF